MILLLIGISLSDALKVEKNLTGTVGGTLDLPGPVPGFGFLSKYGGTVIAMVSNRELLIEEHIYTDRLHWSETTGLFTLTDLQRNDSGIYSIDSKEGKVFTASYNLTVYNSVAPPAVHTLNVSSDSCSLLCAVDKAADITLWWYKDEEMVNQSSSAGPLPLTVTKQDLSSSYRCVAGNPAEEKTLLVDVQMFCSGLNDADLSHHRIIIGVIAGCVGLVAVALVAFLIRRKFFSQSNTTTTGRPGSVDTKPDVQYAVVNMCAGRPSQGGTVMDSPGSVDHHNLMTVYDQLEAHRMVLPDADGHALPFDPRFDDPYAAPPNQVPLPPADGPAARSPVRRTA